MENPYAPPAADVSRIPILDHDAETIRKEHLQHEASIQGLGSLYLLGGLLGTIAFVAIFGIAVIGMTGSSEVAPMGVPELVAGGVLAALCAFQLWLGTGLRKLKPAVRVPAIILSALGLLGFPLGTIISAYFLYLVAGQKGKMVLSARYNEIVRATPHIQYRTPMWLWVLLGLIVGLLVVAVVFGVMSADS